MTIDELTRARRGEANGILPQRKNEAKQKEVERGCFHNLFFMFLTRSRNLAIKHDSFVNSVTVITMTRLRRGYYTRLELSKGGTRAERRKKSGRRGGKIQKKKKNL